MSADIRLDGAMIGISSSLLHGLRRLLTETLGDEADVRLQEAGYAAGEQVYHAFCQWLPRYTGVDDPKDLDAATLEEVLSQFFETLGWGRLHVDRAGKSALAISSANWVEATGDESDDPSCPVSCGMFADFLGRLCGMPIAVMEVSQHTGTKECRFLAGSPETMNVVYGALADGRDYESALPS